MIVLAAHQTLKIEHNLHKCTQKVCNTILHVTRINILSKVTPPENIIPIAKKYSHSSVPIMANGFEESKKPTILCIIQLVYY